MTACACATDSRVPYGMPETNAEKLRCAAAVLTYRFEMGHAIFSFHFLMEQRDYVFFPFPTMMFLSNIPLRVSLHKLNFKQTFRSFCPSVATVRCTDV